MRFTEQGQWELPVRDFEVQQITFSTFLVDIVTYGPEGETAQIGLEGPFELREPNGTTHNLDPQNDAWGQLAALCALRRDTIKLLRFTEMSELRAEFSSGYILTSDGQGPYENWELQAPGGVLVVGTPQKPAIWDGEPENKRFYKWAGTKAIEIPDPTKPASRDPTS